MSRIGLKPITIPEGLTVEVRDGGSFGYKEVVVKGSKGELSESLRPGINVVVEGNEVKLVRTEETEAELKRREELHRHFLYLLERQKRLE